MALLVSEEFKALGLEVTSKLEIVQFNHALSHQDWHSNSCALFAPYTIFFSDPTPSSTP
jgi:hypothetical protein